MSRHHMPPLNQVGPLTAPVAFGGNHIYMVMKTAIPIRSVGGGAALRGAHHRMEVSTIRVPILPSFGVGFFVAFNLRE